MMWTEKYKPKKITELLQVEQTKSLLYQIENYKKPILIYGPTGNGKTTTIHTIASSLNYEILEVNASDIRNTESINNIIGNSIRQSSLFNKSKIILIDELDGVSGNADRGGVLALIKLLDETNFPIIMTANDPWDSKFSTLRKKCNLIEFKKYNDETITSFLGSITKKEDLKINYETLKEIANLNKGDLRASINDLQIVSSTKESSLDDRKKKETAFNVLKNIFKTREVSTYEFDKTDLNLDEAMLWVDENLPLEYSGIDLAKAYDALSKADIFKGRIRKWQYWRFLIYQHALMTYNIAVAKKEINPNFINYKRNSRILKLWIAKLRFSKRKEIAEKIAKYTHTSTKRIIKDYPYIKKILNDKEIIQKFELENKEP